MTRQFKPNNPFNAPAHDPLLERQLHAFDPDAQRRRIVDQAARLGIPLQPSLTSLDDSGALILLGCHASPAGLDVRPDLAPHEFHQLATLLFSLEDGLQLFIGDLLAASDSLGYGDLTALAATYNRDEKTLRNWKYICSHVKMSLRRDVLARYPGTKPLTLGHYGVVASLSPDEQTHFLCLAIEDGLSVAQLRRLVRPPQPTPAVPPVLTLARDLATLLTRSRRSPQHTQQLLALIDQLQSHLSHLRQSLSP